MEFIYFFSCLLFLDIVLAVIYFVWLQSRTPKHMSVFDQAKLENRTKHETFIEYIKLTAVGSVIGLIFCLLYYLNFYA